MEQWFLSDPHFDHENIIKFCSRPFASPKEMNEAIIERHNALVKPEDHWTCLGDITMKRGNQGVGLEHLAKMNGHKRLILGNHDHFDMKHYLKYFEKVYSMNMYDNMRFTHIAVHPDSMGNAIANVHGHIHNGIPNHKPVIQVRDGQVVVKPYINISCEWTDYAPVTLGQIKEMVRKEVEKMGSHTGYIESTKFNLSTQHCEICAPQDKRLERSRCFDHFTS